MKGRASSLTMCLLAGILAGLRVSWTSTNANSVLRGRSRHRCATVDAPGWLTDDAQMQADEFFRTAVVVNHCDAGVCSFPELSGCP